ncbi:hypothetical protein ACSX1A_16890 [Pontibacter sp. MBLB2868]|uniref:hypothetical protein n=1 Tax=Pontibacter sp. MBLB2868 TaxID=3451555 RepID=UPI003F7505CA
MISTKLLMTATAIVMGVTGLALSFFPQEIAESMNGTAPANAIVMQVLGAVYFGFATTNWMAKANLIGGIYGRPIALGNFAHFMIAALALVKLSFKAPTDLSLLAITITYSIFALLFGYLVFTHPAAELKQRKAATGN